MSDPEAQYLLRSTTRAFEKVLHAVLDADKPAARQVLRGSAGRRKSRAAITARLRADAWVPVPRLVEELRFIADIGRVGDLVDQLARHVIRGGDSIPLSSLRREEVADLLGAGGDRLRQLCDGPCAENADQRRRGGGTALHEVAGCCARERSATLALCAALAAALLDASRHSSRAA